MKKHTKSVTISLRIAQVMDNFLKKKVKQITGATKVQISKAELIRCFIIDEMDREKDDTLSMIKEVSDLEKSNDKYKITR